MIVDSEYTVKLSEIDRKQKATNKAILSYLEDVGGTHSDLAGYGIFDICKTHLTWLLLEWKLQVIKRPKYKEKIKVETWSKNAIKCYAYRDFKIYDEKGNVIGLATSKWVLVDTQKEKIVKVEPEILERYQPEFEKSAFPDEDFPKMHELEKYKIEKEYNIRRSDIDVNNHMHNLNYLDLANEVLPEEVLQNGELNNVRITYKKEIKLGEIVKCKYNLVDGKHIIIVKSQDDSVLHAIIELH